MNQTQGRDCGNPEFIASQWEAQVTTWTWHWHLKRQSWGTKPLTCVIWFYLHVDSVRIELNCRTPSWFHRNAWWEGKKKPKPMHCNWCLESEYYFCFTDEEGDSKDKYMEAPSDNFAIQVQYAPCSDLCIKCSLRYQVNEHSVSRRLKHWVFSLDDSDVD